MNKGKLYLIPVFLGESSEVLAGGASGQSLSLKANSRVLPSFNAEVINTIYEFIVENERSARSCLKQLGYTKSLQEVILHPLNEQTPIDAIGAYLAAAEQGKNIGLLSEAGCPAVADPGAELVRLAHQKNIQVVPLVGPSSILLALMASGMNGQNFCFNGYLPKEQKERISKLRKLEQLANSTHQTQLFIETPYRNKHILEDVLSTCSDSTNFCIACDLTLDTEYIKTQTIAEWKKQKPDIHKRPAIFLIG